jgi:hypothetical protein
LHIDANTENQLRAAECQRPAVPLPPSADVVLNLNFGLFHLYLLLRHPTLVYWQELITALKDVEVDGVGYEKPHEVACVASGEQVSGFAWWLQVEEAVEWGPVNCDL